MDDVALRIDDEAEAANHVLVGGDEESAFLAADVTPATGRSNALDKAGFVV